MHCNPFVHKNHYFCNNEMGEIYNAGDICHYDVVL